MKISPTEARHDTMIFQIFLLDVKGKVLIARNYRGEIDSNVIDKFMPLLMEKGESIFVTAIWSNVTPIIACFARFQRRRAW